MRMMRDADRKSTRLNSSHQINTLFLHDALPIFGRGVDGAIQFGAMFRQRIIERDVENELFEMLQMRRQRSQLLGMHMAECDDAEAQGLLLDLLVNADDARC